MKLEDLEGEEAKQAIKDFEEKEYLSDFTKKYTKKLDDNDTITTISEKIDKLKEKMKIIEKLEIKPQEAISETIILSNKINEVIDTINELERKQNLIFEAIRFVTQLANDKIKLSDEDFLKKYNIK